MNPSPAPQNPVVESPVDELIDEESLVEEVSIDGMCGVY